MPQSLMRRSAGTRSFSERLGCAAQLIHPGTGWSANFKRTKFYLRTLNRLNATKEWFALLEQPHLTVVAASHPKVLTKLQKPYLHRGLSTYGRLAILREHFGFVTRNVTSSALRNIYQAGGLLLATITLAETGRFELRLLYSDRFVKEGDLSIALIDADTGAILFSLTFSVAVDDGTRRELFVGGIQGNKWANDRERIVAMTRSMHGLRPKALLVFALRQLAMQWHVDSLRAVSEKMHIYRHWSYLNRSKRKSVTADYDLFWNECGGTQELDGMFSVPLNPGDRKLSTLKPNKRSVYRRRYEMLDGFANQIASNLAETVKSTSDSIGI